MPESQTPHLLLPRLSRLSGLQLFQLIRYGTFVLVGIGFAKIHLPQSLIGHFETFILISGMVTYFWVSGQINAMLSLFPKLEARVQKQLYFNTFVSLLTFGCIAALFLWIFSGTILSFLDKQNEGNFLLYILAYLLLNSPSFLIEYILYLQHQKNALLYYALAFSLLTLSAVLLPVLLGYGIEYSFYGLIGLAAVKLLVSLLLISRFGSFELNFDLLRQNFRLSLPLMLSILVSGSAEYIDGIIVKAKFDNVAFAVYRYGAKELPVLLIIANTFSSAMIPVVAAKLDDGLGEIKRKSAQLMHLFFPLSMVLMLLSHHLFLYVFNSSFVFSAFIFNIYLLLIIPRLLFPQTILTGLQHTGYLLISSVLEISINVSLSIWLAGKAGLPGIALGTLVAYTFDKLFLASVLYFRYGISPRRYLSLAPFFIYTVLLLGCFVGGYWIALNF